MPRVRRNRISGQFAARLIEMLESPAYRVLSLSAHMVLARIEIEHAHHGGAENGRLPVTYDQFVDYGLHRHAIAPAIRELVVLGFIEITERGRSGNGESRSANKFRLTFKSAGNLPETNEWRKIPTTQEAQLIARVARQASERPQRRGVPMLRAVT